MRWCLKNFVITNELFWQSYWKLMSTAHGLLMHLSFNKLNSPQVIILITCSYMSCKQCFISTGWMSTMCRMFKYKIKVWQLNCMWQLDVLDLQLNFCRTKATSCQHKSEVPIWNLPILRCFDQHKHYFLTQYTIIKCMFLPYLCIPTKL